MSDITLEGGMFALDPSESRLIRGVLLPYGEQSRASLTDEGGLMFGAGDIDIPRDPSVVTLNRDHDRFDPIGRAVELEDTDAGILAAFRVADTPEGDEYLAEYQNGGRRKLSAEIGKYVSLAGEVVRRTLTGAAVVPEGAFAGAHLFQLAVIDEPINEQVQTAPADTDDHETTDQTPVESDITGEEPEEPKEDAMPEAVAPVTLGSGAQPESQLTKGDLFAAISESKQFGTPIDAKFRAGGELFALGAATGNLGNVIAPQYIGQVWEGGDYVQKWLPLFASGDLTSLTVTGWRSVLRPTVAAYAGDGAAVGGSAFTTELVTDNAQRYAGGNTLPREYYDFNATEFVDAWAKFARDDYARKADAYVRTAALAAATPIVSTVPGTEPSLPVIRRIIDGIFAIAADPINARASFAMIPDEDYKLLLHTGHSDLLEYLRLALNVEEGSVLGFHLGWDSSLTAGSVVVGARESAKVRQLPGSPIRINAANVANGSFDEALFGYVHFMDEFPDALVIVDDTP